jgi:hypothetical protein
MSFSLDRDGYFLRDGQPFLPVGVNYWPASCGVELWSVWPEAELRADLVRVRQLGLNTLRFFLRWQDFEPEAGRYAEASWSRLDQLLGWCREEGIVAHPSLFVGFMSGGVFWPDWKGEGNLFSDPFLRERAVSFASRAGEIIGRHRDTVLAIDQGNELCCLPDSLAAPPHAVAAWCGDINAALRRVCPDLLLVSGNEQNQVIHDTGWRLGAQPGVDFLSMHAYPVPAWHAVAFDGMGDPLGRSLLPFYTACARAFGPVLVQEFGTLLNSGESQVRGYLDAVLPACAAAGANGYLWWCLHDILSEAHPYAKCPFERGLGLLDRRGAVKSGLDVFLRFARSAAAGPPRDARPVAGLYWPSQYYPRGNPFNPGNVPQRTSRPLALAHFALNELGRSVRVVRGDQPLPAPAQCPVLVLSGVCVTGPEWAALDDWVEQGGRLLLLGLDAFSAGDHLHRLLGARVVDFRAPLVSVATGIGAGTTWRCFPRDLRAELSPDSAEVLAASSVGEPLILRHHVGAGSVLAVSAEIDRQAADEAPDPASRAAWLSLWRSLLQALTA